MYSFHKNGTLPTDDSIFVFGSNLSGRHGAGAALVAKQKFGAVYGIGIGFIGQSYAIPTKDKNIQTLPLETIIPFIELFKQFTHENPDKKFWVTAIGCGLAGFKNNQVAPYFIGCNSNCSFPEEWKQYIEPN